MEGRRAEPQEVYSLTNTESVIDTKLGAVETVAKETGFLPHGAQGQEVRGSSVSWGEHKEIQCEAACPGGVEEDPTQSPGQSNLRALMDTRQVPNMVL